MKQLQQTHTVVTFEFTTDKEAELIILLQLVFSLVMVIYLSIQTASRGYHHLVTLAGDVWQAISFIGKIYAIGFNSLRWGLGL